MKRLLLALLPLAAQAQTPPVYNVEGVPGKYILYSNNLLVSRYNTQPECSTAATKLKQTTSKTVICQNTVTYIRTPKPVEPPPDMHVGLPVSDPSTWPVPQPGVDGEWLAQTGYIPPSRVTWGWEEGGDFRLICNWSKMGYDDPIVYPGAPGKAHHHTFFSNTAIDAFTTSANIRSKGNATCRGGTINKSGYWIPSLIDTATNKPLAPKDLLIYYKTGNWPYFNNNPPIAPLPPGLKMIAGDPTRTTAGGVGTWLCLIPSTGSDRPGTKGSSIPTNCQPGDELWANIPFPQCWDGKNLDSPDHKSHLAYHIQFWTGDPQRQYRCPDTHPVVLPAITFLPKWNVPASADTSKWRLSSDVYSGPAGYSLHGDWINGWDPAITELWGQKCMTEKRDCGSANLGDGRVTQEFQGN